MVTSDAVFNAIEVTYISLSQLGIQGDTASLTNIWETMADNTQALLDVTKITDTVPESSKAMIILQKLNSGRGRILLISKESNNIYSMCLDGYNTPTGIWEKIVIETMLSNYFNTNIRAADNDTSTKTYNLENGYRYLIVISHPIQTSAYIGLVTVYNGTKSELTTIVQTDNKITVTINHLVLTVEATTSAKTGIMRLDKWI